jgi:hypothetical protein
MIGYVQVVSRLAGSHGRVTRANPSLNTSQPGPVAGLSGSSIVLSDARGSARGAAEMSQLGVSQDHGHASLPGLDKGHYSKLVR